MTLKPLFSMIPIEKTDVFRTVFTRLTELIEQHRLEPGDRLPSERELSESLGVSRTTVRQGIKVLESMGKLETRVGSGTYVASGNILYQFELPGLEVDEKLLRDVCVAREGIEKTVFREFMENHRTPKAMRELEALLDAEAKNLKGSAGKNRGDIGYDFTLEAKAAELTGNRIIAFQQRQIHKLWAYSWSQIGRMPEKRKVLHLEHRLIMEAIRDKDGDLLDQRISAHVNKNINPRAFGERDSRNCATRPKKVPALRKDTREMQAGAALHTQKAARQNRT